MTQPIEKSRGAPEGPLIGYFRHCQRSVCPSQWPRNIHRHCERSEAISSLRRFAAPMAGTRAERWFAMRGDNDQLASFWMPFTANRGFKARSEEHTSELQSLMRISYAVFCFKKKKNKNKIKNNINIYNYDEKCKT